MPQSQHYESQQYEYVISQPVVPLEVTEYETFPYKPQMTTLEVTTDSVSQANISKIEFQAAKQANETISNSISSSLLIKKDFESFSRTLFMFYFMFHF